MTDDEQALLEEQLRKAETPEARLEVWLLWWPHMARCLASTNRHVKGTEATLERIDENLNDLAGMIEKYHGKTSWKADKLGWLKENWMWVVVFLYMLQSLGVEGVFGKLAALFGG
ncbi:MAG TPA: hypothetical protein IAC79_05445 [Candidatus Spyradenecus faecavium]|uniref:Uncharacterized protein n=1 Tax=Candidatus Spyradenecus faecavium TaxID=2840947 RepID=A0A9D1T3Q5_9BACT|nr:hypothetical protein [Candidatus Spyradenecus faecavium]